MIFQLLPDEIRDYVMIYFGFTFLISSFATAMIDFRPLRRKR